MNHSPVDTLTANSKSHNNKWLTFYIDALFSRMLHILIWTEYIEKCKSLSTIGGVLG